MCQRLQNSAGEVAKNGKLKFCGTLNPKINAAPISMIVQKREIPLDTFKDFNEILRLTFYKRNNVKKIIIYLIIICTLV